MKLVVDVRSDKINTCKRRVNERYSSWYDDIIAEGVPLEKAFIKELKALKKKVLKYCDKDSPIVNIIDERIFDLSEYEGILDNENYGDKHR